MKHIILKERKNEELALSISKKLNFDMDIIQYLINCDYDERTINYLITSDYIDVNIDIKNLEEGVDKLIEYLAEDNLTIYIRSDYDSDGMNAAFISKSILDIIGELLELNITTVVLDVDRADGYGINKRDCFKIINDKADNKIVLILDNGITKADCTDLLYKHDIESIVIDHHVPREIKDVPNDGSIVIDPHFNDKKNEDAKGLCGAALTFFFFKLLMKKLGDDSDFIESYAANAAIATITDCMPTNSINAALVANGMKRINNQESSLAINYYREVKNENIIPKDIAFELGPQLNACGRMHKTSCAIDYLLEEDDFKIVDSYDNLKKINDERKKIEKETMSVIDDYIHSSDKVIMAILENKNDGILGSLASKLLSKYNKPIILFSKDSDGILRGSARSAYPVDLHELFTRDEIKNYIDSFGGHAQAAGIAIKENNFLPLKEAFNELIRKNKELDLSEHKKNKVFEVDKMVKLDYISNENLKKHRNVMYFNDLKEPLLCIPNLEITSTRTSSNPQNICFNFSDNSIQYTREIWIWGFTDNYKEMGSPKKVHLIGRLSSMFGNPTLDVVEMIDANEVEI